MPQTSIAVTLYGRKLDKQFTSQTAQKASHEPVFRIKWQASIETPSSHRIVYAPSLILITGDSHQITVDLRQAFWLIIAYDVWLIALRPSLLSFPYYQHFYYIVLSRLPRMSHTLMYQYGHCRQGSLNGYHSLFHLTDVCKRALQN